MENTRLLLVDDETDFRSAMSKRLRKKGFDVLEAGNGDECRSVMDKAQVDVMILDMKMPGMNGLQVLEWVGDHFPGTEVILLTGHACAVEGVEGIKKGAFDYLTKPVEFEHLVQKVQQAVERKRYKTTKQEEMALKTLMGEQMAAAERLASLGILSAGIAREIERPLAVINECAEYLRLLLCRAEKAALPWKEDLESILRKMEAAIDRAGRIVKPLRDFDRQSERTTEQTNVKSLVSSGVQLVLEKTKEKNIDIVLDMEQSNGVIWSDPDDLRQVIGHLIANALTAVESDGTITIELADTDAGVRLSIKDTGHGIPVEHLKKIFEPFFTTRPEESPGLGLYMVSVIVERLGGKIEVSSRVREGTIFQVTLPRIRKD